MLRISLFVSLIILTFSILSFQHDIDAEYPQNDFTPPVKHAMRLSGTFGELRPNHFHAGIDIKPIKGVGDPIYCIGNGHVSRIKVSARGYGNALYIDHPNGYTSVYAHLKNFNTAIGEYIKQNQYEQQSFEIELFPDSTLLPLTKGEQVGTLGISGRSFGPHLHFEIRETLSEKPVNPFHFGWKLNDAVAPMINQMAIYFLDPEMRQIKKKEYTPIKGSSRYYISGDTLTIGAWRVGFALKAFDKMNSTKNWNGIYSLSMKVDGEKVYQFKMDKLSFDENRYINAHMDYRELKTEKSYYNRCFRLPGNQLSIYDLNPSDEIITLTEGKAKKIEFEVKDVNGNTSNLVTWIKRGKVEPYGFPKSEQYQLFWNESNSIHRNDISLLFAENCLYENLYMDYERLDEKSNGAYSDLHSIGDELIPIHCYFDIGISPHSLPDRLYSKAVIASCQPKKAPVSYGGEWRDGKLWTKVRALGDYMILIDTIPPTIKTTSFKPKLSKGSRISFEISDDFSGIQSYEGRINGEWVLMQYDEKYKSLFYYLDLPLEPGEHIFNLSVTDERQNIASITKKFTF